MFEDDLAACSTQQAFPAASSQAAAPVKGLGLASDPKSSALSQHKHIKVNSLYVYKGGAKVYTLKEMADHDDKLCHEPYFGNNEGLEVKLADLKHLKEWKKAKPRKRSRELVPGFGRLLFLFFLGGVAYYYYSYSFLVLSGIAINLVYGSFFVH